MNLDFSLVSYKGRGYLMSNTQQRHYVSCYKSIGNLWTFSGTTNGLTNAVNEEK